MIKQLALQAGLWRQHYDIGEESPARLELFAELIVRECVKIADNHYDTKSAIHDIKEHFGVEL